MNDGFGPVESVECGKGQLEAADQIVRFSIHIGDQDRVRLEEGVPLVRIDGFDGVVEDD